MPNTWEEDASSGDGKPVEKGDFDLGAAVTLAVAAEEPVEDDEGGKKEMKMLVFADAERRERRQQQHEAGQQVAGHRRQAHQPSPEPEGEGDGEGNERVLRAACAGAIGGRRTLGFRCHRSRADNVCRKNRIELRDSR